MNISSYQAVNGTYILGLPQSGDQQRCLLLAHLRFKSEVPVVVGFEIIHNAFTVVPVELAARFGDG